VDSRLSINDTVVINSTTVLIFVTLHLLLACLLAGRVHSLAFTSLSFATLHLRLWFYPALALAMPVLDLSELNIILAVLGECLLANALLNGHSANN